jgi:hypothetical protein
VLLTIGIRGVDSRSISMDPAALKLFLDEFNRRFDEWESRWDRRFSPRPATEPQDAPSIASALIGSSTTASTDEPSLVPTLGCANSGVADNSMFVTTSSADSIHRIHELEKAGDATVEDDAAFGSLVAMASKPPPTPIAAQVAQQIRSAGKISHKAGLPFSDTADHLFGMELDTNQNTEFRVIIGNHVLVSVPSAIASYYDDGDRAFRNLTLASSEARQVRMDYDDEERCVDVTMASLRMAKPSSPLLSTAYNLSTVFTNVARVGSVVNVASKLCSTSFDAQAVLDEMPTSDWRSPGRFLDVQLWGHFVGHYLGATAKMWASTHNDTLNAKMSYIVNALYDCQKKMGIGYLSAFPSEFFVWVEAITSVWAPYYTIHKIMQGLLDQYTVAGNSVALVMVVKMVNYFSDRVKNVIQNYSIETHWESLNEKTGGMNDVFYQLYTIMNDTKHLTLAPLFDKPCFLGLLAGQDDSISGFHSNTRIPVAIGAQMRYKVTGDPLYKQIASFFMDTDAVLSTPTDLINIVRALVLSQDIALIIEPGRFWSAAVIFHDQERCHGIFQLAASFMGFKIKNRRSILPLPWDPGGIDAMYRLEGKPNFKKGGMSGTAGPNGPCRPR